jgi:hypothetical protein
MVITKLNNQNKKDKNLPFKNVEGFRKDLYTRERKISLIKKSGILKGKYVHLPSQSCADALMLNKKISNNKFQYIGFENNKKVVPFLYQKLYKEKILMDIHIGNIGDKTKFAKNGEYAHIDFDFCGTASKYFNDVSLAIKNKIVQVGGLIFMSFTMRDEKYSSTESLKNLIKKHLTSNFELVDDEVRWYSDSNKSANKMMFAAIRRIK